MSLKRTPPMAINRPNLLKTPISLYGSDPQLHVSSEHPASDHTDHNITRRLKRRLLDDSENSSENISIAQQISDMFESFEVKQNSKLEKLMESVLVVREQNSEIQKSLDFLSTKYDDLIAKVLKLEHHNKAYEVKIMSLENRIEQIERNSRASSVEIRNIPKLPSENKALLGSLVKSVGEVIQHPITDSDIRDVLRLKTKKETSGNIVVNFSTTYCKDGFLKQCRIFNGARRDDKLNTAHLKLPGPAKPVYIDESLTSMGRRLAYLARQFIKEHNYHSTWTSYGKIFIKRLQDSPALRIDCEVDLKNLLSK